jgi:ABC-type bacteriocin/lantibiotic exporter with double-glycine peptidase domain
LITYEVPAAIKRGAARGKAIKGKSLSQGRMLYLKEICRDSWQPISQSQNVRQMITVPYYKQEKPYSCGPACLRMVLEYLGLKFTENELIQICGTTRLGTAYFRIGEVAESLNFEAETFSQIEREGLDRLLEEGPVIALMDPSKLYGGISGIGHFVVIIGKEERQVVYHNPIMGEALKINAERFFQAWQEFDLRGVRIWKPIRK